MTLQIYRKQIGTSLIIFDRDDTLIEDRPAIHEFNKVVWLPGRVTTLRELSSLGFDIAIATNQGAVAKGLITIKQLESFHDDIADFLVTNQVNLFAIAFCPHHPNGDRDSQFTKICYCRKPSPGLINEICNVDPNRYKKIFLFGDKDTDLLAAQNTIGYEIVSSKVLPKEDFSVLVRRKVLTEC
jgi:D-glycero-D-manno-heptose 1,7-bisphosphate phosphatase